MKTLESKAIPVFTYECMDRVFGLCNTPVSDSSFLLAWNTTKTMEEVGMK